jgi:hypothetical protein
MPEEARVEIERIGVSVDGGKFAQVKVTAFGHAHVSSFPVGPLGGDDPKDFFDWLSESGIPVQRQEKEALKQSISTQLNRALIELEGGHKGAPAIAIDRRGWNVSAFATKYAVHGPQGRDLLRTAQCTFIDNSAADAKPIDRVRAFYKKFGRGNALVKFVSCVSFVGPLLTLMKDAPQPMFLLVGAPHTGKSSLLFLAGSPWGGRDDGPLGYVSSLSGTANAIEAIAAEHRDMLLTLDDVQNLTPDPAKRGQAIFDLLLRISSGRVRSRQGEKTVNYRTTVIAASNDATATLLKQGRVIAPDALLDRVFDLPCKYEYGIFATVPDDSTAEEFVRAMKARANSLRGCAGEHFIKELVKRAAADRSGLVKKLERWRKEARNTLRDPRLSPRAVDAFACIFAAGCFAAEIGILPWSQDMLIRQFERVFKGHVTFTRGELANWDPIKLIKRYIKSNAAQLLKAQERQARKLSDRDLAKCAGVEMSLRGGTIEYWLGGKDLDKALDKKVDRRVAEKKLVAAGLIELDREGKPPKQSLGSKRPRVYRIDAKKLHKAKTPLSVGHPEPTRRRASNQ